MNSILLSFVHGVFEAAAIWLALFAVTVLALSVMLGRPKRERLPQEQRVRGVLLKKARLTAQYEELQRIARQMAVAAERAAQRAQRSRELWLTSQTQAQAAWEAYQAGDTEARRLTLAAALPTPKTPATPSEYAARERFLHKAALRACSHRQLSALDLSDALAHRNGWDPRRHPVEQELVLRRVARDGLRETYRLAALREAEAYQSANTAIVAARGLREEAHLAAEKARNAARALPPGRLARRDHNRPNWSVQTTAGLRLIDMPLR